MKLILTGGGSGEKTRELDELFASLLNKSKPLLYIPIAINTKEHPYPECLKWIKETFDELDVKTYDMWTEKDLKKSKTINPEEFSGIYIGGGNTPYLLKILKESNFWDFLKKAIKLGIPIYGGSAGAIIFAKTIIPSLSADENEVGITDFKGMNILNDFEFWAHYEDSLEPKVQEFIEKYGLKKIIAVPEDCGLVIEDNQTKVIGKSPAIVFENNNKKIINSGEFIN
jgi:dipeptidase E